MSLKITFTGLEADQHHIEANEGLESLSGLAHAATLVAHFVATNTVRQRQPYTNDLRFYFERTQPGSLAALLAIGGDLALGTAGNIIYDILKIVWKRATGTDADAEGDVEIAGRIYKSGDLDALTEAVSPSLLRGHAWINQQEQNISIEANSKRIVKFDQNTKEYLKSQIKEEGKSSQDVSVAALNVNSRHGRVYFFDLGRTIPFRVDKHAHPRTIANLSSYLAQYAQKTGATVNIEFKKIFHIDGKLKRIVIFDCYPISDLE